MLGAEVVEESIEIGREFTGGLFETEHELIILRAFCFSVVLLVGSVVFEDLVGVFGDADFFGLELLAEGDAEVVAGYFEFLDFGKVFCGGGFQLDLEAGAGGDCRAVGDEAVCEGEGCCRGQACEDC